MEARSRALAAAVEAAPVFGIAVWIALLVTHPGDYAYMFVWFMPGLVMLATAFVIAAVTMIVAPRGFVRAHARGSFRFHGIVGIVTVVLLVVQFTAMVRGLMPAAQTMVILFGLVLPIVEIGRSLMYGIAAARGRPR